MDHDELISWLLDGDVSIQYQVYRDLLLVERSDLQARITKEGWGNSFLDNRQPEGHWGKRFYEPKWISSHYTLLDLRNLNLSENHSFIKESIDRILREEKSPDGGIGPFGDKHLSDVCVNGMFLNYASYFKTDPKELESIVDFLLHEFMPDGGFNCRSNRGDPVHSSLHSTISVLEGITEFQRHANRYRFDDLEQAKRSGIEFILQHRLFLSDRTGEIINKEFLKLHFPCRWRYDILRALDYFQYEQLPWDDRLQSAIDVLMKKRNKEGTWKVNAHYPGKQHFIMEKAGQPSRWNTLRALRVLKHFNR